MAVEAVRAGAARSWQRSYPPLALMAVAVLIAAVILPSRLNLPQSNPSTVLEYAPVPPEDTDETPPGNVSSLGLGSSNTLSLGGKPPPPPPPPPEVEQGVGGTLRNKRCVGDPPRQTEDPMSPPCVPYFDGDNFGTTYQGVKGDEITVVLYWDYGSYNYEYASRANVWTDLDREARESCPKTYPNGPPPEEQVKCDGMPIRIARGFNKYFNERFQTYGRRVHYWMYVTSAQTDSGRRADAAMIWSEKKPFAVLDQATFSGHNQAFEETLASRGVLVFTSETALPNAFFRSTAPNTWGFWPDVEHWSASYVSYICQKVAPFEVSHAGSSQGSGAPNGSARVYGFWHTSDKAEPGLRHFYELTKKSLKEQCGVVPAREQAFPNNGFVTDGSDDGTPARLAVADFRNAGVTTILYMGGIEGKLSVEAANQNYYPEIVFAGDNDADNNVTARYQHQATWQNAWGTQYQIRMDAPTDNPGYRAYREGFPRATAEEARYAEEWYRDHYMLFQAIQVAGPKLSAASVDKGFHAIPPKQSTDPRIASIYFDPGDYSSIKDAMEVWWDVDGLSPGGQQPGCYRMVREGLRFPAAKWESGDDAFGKQSDPCTGFEGARRLRAGG